MKKATKRHAAQAYRENAEDALALIELLKEKLAGNDEREADWGHVGSASQVRELLMQAALFLDGDDRRGDEEGDAERRMGERLNLNLKR